VLYGYGGYIMIPYFLMLFFKDFLKGNLYSHTLHKKQAHFFDKFKGLGYDPVRILQFTADEVDAFYYAGVMPAR